MLIRQFLSFILVVTLLVPITTNAKSNILFILDGSNSMWGQIEGEAKILSAQNVLSELLNDLPSDTQTGLIAYGHRKEGSCKDIEVLSGIGENSIDTLTKKINALKPKGKTPIAGALQKSLHVLSKYKQDNNNVVLISDGIESCNGDPCTAAKALADAGINARVHVVGFDVNEEGRKQLKCIPEMGNGKYFNAANVAELKFAAAEVKKIAVVEAPPPPKTTIWFEDNFEGEELSEHWEVINPNPNSYIVENGVLTVLATEATPLAGSGKLENIFLLSKGVPDGDWTATMRFIPKVATLRERYILALYKDKDTMLSAGSSTYLSGYNTAEMRLYGDKVVDGKPTTSYESRVLLSPQPPHDSAIPRWQIDWTLANEKAVFLRIKKSGRKYTVSSKVEGETTMANGKKPQWIVLQDITSLRPPGDSFVMALTQTYKSGGEALMEIDWFKIETMQ